MSISSGSSSSSTVAAVALDYGEFVLLGSLCDHLAKEGKKEGMKEGKEG